MESDNLYTVLQKYPKLLRNIVSDHNRVTDGINVESRLREYINTLLEINLLDLMKSPVDLTKELEILKKYRSNLASIDELRLALMKLSVFAGKTDDDQI
jgi:hypothetical protein